MTQPTPLQIGEIWERTWTVADQSVKEQRVVVGQAADGTVEWACWPFDALQFITSSAVEWQRWQQQASLIQAGFAAVVGYSRHTPTQPGYYSVLWLATRTERIVRLPDKVTPPAEFRLYGPRLSLTPEMIKSRRQLG